jgi:hypothetical protein
MGGESEGICLNYKGKTIGRQFVEQREGGTALWEKPRGGDENPRPVGNFMKPNVATRLR